MFEKELASELEKMNGHRVSLLTRGIIDTSFIINKLKYEIVHDILTIKGENLETFTFNTNQISKLSTNGCISLSTDSDLEIQINEIKKMHI